jgi:hypothetical protein
MALPSFNVFASWWNMRAIAVAGKRRNWGWGVGVGYSLIRKGQAMKYLCILLPGGKQRNFQVELLQLPHIRSVV